MGIDGHAPQPLTQSFVVKGIGLVNLKIKQTSNNEDDRQAQEDAKASDPAANDRGSYWFHHGNPLEPAHSSCFYLTARQEPSGQPRGNTRQYRLGRSWRLLMLRRDIPLLSSGIKDDILV